MDYKRKTDAELEQLAQDSAMIEDPRMIGMVFLVLSLLDREHLKAMEAAGIASFYEYIDKAGPRSINGMPSFMSVQSLDLHDTRELFRRAAEIQELLDARKKVPT